MSLMVPQRVVGSADGDRLLSRYHVKLLDEEPVEGIVIQPGRSGHTRMMRSGCDKILGNKRALWG
jgi:hypothetical protein